jgi:hypothetical protein
VGPNRVTYDEAKLLLLMHGPGTSGPNGEPLIAERGFVHSLRPYEGNLVERNFHLVMEALFTVGETLYRSQQVDRELIHAIWVICDTARAYGLHPQGMLQRNKLISQTDTNRLERWVDAIETTALTVLGGGPPHYRLTRYAEYVTEVGWWDNIDFFIPLLERAISDRELLEPQIQAQALGRLGGRARRALPTLYQALARRYTYYSPEERCTEEVHAVIRAAIQQIESAPSAE